MEIYYTIFLLGTATMLAGIAEFEEVIPKTLKKTFRVLSISLMLISLIVSVIFEVQKSKREEADKNERINKEKEILKSIVLSYDTVKSIQKSLNKQLITQNSLTQATSKLLVKNEKLFISQKAITEDVNRINNPLFPANVFAIIEIPFSADNFLEGYFKNIKGDILFHKESLENGIIIEHNDFDQSIASITFADSCKLYKNKILQILDSYTRFPVGLFKPPINKTDTGFHAKFGAYFYIGDTSKITQKFVNVIINYNQKRCFLIIDCLEQPPVIIRANMVWGFNDLENSYVIFPYSPILKSKVDFFSLRPVRGTQKSCSFSLYAKDVEWVKKYGLKEQFHKVTEKDFNKYFSIDKKEYYRFFR